jgi:hypothetical protein
MDWKEFVTAWANKERPIELLKLNKKLEDQEIDVLLATFPDSQRDIFGKDVCKKFDFSDRTLKSRWRDIYSKIIKDDDNRIPSTIDDDNRKTSTIKDKWNQWHLRHFLVNEFVRVANKDYFPIKIESILPIPERDENSQLLTPENLEIPSRKVHIQVDLKYAAGTESLFRDLSDSYPEIVNDKNDIICFKALPDTKVEEAFRRKNKIREGNNLKPETTDYRLLRLIGDPITKDGLILKVSPVSWELYSVVSPYPDDGSLYKPDKDLEKSINIYKDEFAKEISEYKYISHFVPLGIEALVITKDNFLLLRRKDRNTTVGSNAFDVSFSGYVRLHKDWCDYEKDEKDKKVKYHLTVNLDSWAQKELYRETNTTVNLEEASIFGIHQNKSTKAMDVMAYFHVNMSSEEMYEKMYLNKQLDIERARHPKLSHMTDKYWVDRENELKLEFRKNKIRRVPNSQGAPEAEVRETDNYFVKLNEIDRFINEEKDGKKRTFLPEAREVIIQTLKLINKSQFKDRQV